VIVRLGAGRSSLWATLSYVAILLALIAWVAGSDAAYRDLQASYDLKSEMLDALKERSLTAPANSASASVDFDKATIWAPSETVAASALQRYLLERLERAGGVVQSVQAEAKSETVPPGFQRLSAQLGFDASITALQGFLFEIETGLPLVFVDSLAVQPAPAVQPDAQVGDRVRVALTVTSYWKTVEKAGADR
jgi:type II secretion system (T2SS) protein M